MNPDPEPEANDAPVDAEGAECAAVRGMLGATSVYAPGPAWQDDLPFESQTGFPPTLEMWKGFVTAGRMRVHGVAAGRPAALLVSWRGIDREAAHLLAAAVPMVVDGTLRVETVAGLPAT